MDFMDAIQWLNDSGGTWSVGATPTICVVIAAVGALEVAVPAGQLRADQVHAALVLAVERLRARFSGKTPPRRERPKQPSPPPILAYAEEDA